MWNCAGRSRTITTGAASSSLSAPSGNAVRNSPTAMSFALRRLSCSSTRWIPLTHGDWRVARPPRGPNEASGGAAAALIPRPPAPGAAPSTPRRGTPPPPPRPLSHPPPAGAGAARVGPPLARLLARPPRLAGHDRRSGGEGEREPDREAERLVVRPRDVEHREGRAAQGGEQHQHDGNALRPAARADVVLERLRLFGRLFPGWPLAPRPAQEQRRREQRRRDPPQQRAHPRILSPISRAARISAARPSSHATKPSGIGPIWPIAQPPLSSGACV